jgi:hypothetical protein
MEPRSGCAINAAVEALGDHWSFQLLRDAIFGDRSPSDNVLVGDVDGERVAGMRRSFRAHYFTPLVKFPLD